MTPQHYVRGELPQNGEVRQFTESFNGELRAPEWNPPLEVGKEYLLFLRVNPDSGRLAVNYPFIYIVVDDRLYWAGARLLLEQGASIDPALSEWSDPRFALWDVPVDEAIVTLSDAARKPAPSLTASSAPETP